MDSPAHVKKWRVLDQGITASYGNGYEHNQSLCSSIRQERLPCKQRVDGSIPSRGSKLLRILAFFLYKKNQDASTEAPAHKISRKLFNKISAAVSVRKLSGNAIQLNTSESFSEIKQRFAPIKSAEAIILPVRDWKENLLLSYPIADQRSHPAY